MVFCIEEPNGQQGVAYIAVGKIYIRAGRCACGITCRRGCEHGRRAVLYAFVGTRSACVGINIVLVGKISGKVGSAEFLEVRIVIRLKRLHVCVVHFFGAVHRYTLERDITAAK